MSRRFAQVIAGLGALAGGYVHGKRMKESADADAERMDWEREERERVRAERQASASTLGQVGKTTGAAVSGEDALAAGNQALENAIAGAGSPEEAATIREQYAPTIAALAAQRGTAEQAGTAYTQEQAQGDFVKKMYGIDPTKAAAAESTQLQLEEGREKADKLRRFKTADSELRAWGDKHAPKDADGNLVIDDDSFIKMGKMRSILLAKNGLHDAAMQNAAESMQYVSRKIQADNAVRGAETDKALRAFDKGDYSVALKVYDMVPDGSKATGVKVGKDGAVTVSRISSLDGAKLSPVVFKSLADLRASIEGMKDPNAVINHVERTFKRDIESRKVAADESRAGSAAKVASAGLARDSRAEKREDALIAANVAYQTALDSGDAKDLKKARSALVAAGGKVEKEGNEFSSSIDSMGNTVAITNKKTGAVDIVNARSGAKKTITPSGATGATAGAAQPKTQAEFDAMKSGTVYVDPEDGKTYRKP